MTAAEKHTFAHKTILLIPKCNTSSQSTSQTDFSLPIEDPDNKCVNTLELVPSTDALIEVPIKKTVKKPKIYETKTEINITSVEDPYEMILFKGKPETLPSNSSERAETENETPDAFKDPYSFKLAFESVEPSKTNETVNINAKVFVEDPDYEPIDARYFSTFDSDIWWEGTYRNLSIVPEEDEENLSIRESLSSQHTNLSLPHLPYDRNPVGEEIYTQEFYPSSSSNIKSDSLSVTSSSSAEDNNNMLEEDVKIPRAEVKLLVKSDSDSKSIEVRSVREFIKDTVEKSNGKCKIIDRKKRSQTLPNKFSEGISNLSSKLNNLLEKKKSSSYSFLPDKCEPDALESNTRPTFTLQRLFVRTKDTLNEHCNKELIATSSEKFPLNYDLTPDNPKVDLYANLPFYPCYDQYPLTKSTPFTSIPILNNPKSDGAYCDWLLQKEESCKGKVN